MVQAALGAGAITTIQFLLRQQAVGENGARVPLPLSKLAMALFLATAVAHPLDVVAARAAAGRPRGRAWEWAGAVPSAAYLVLWSPVRFSVFNLPVRCLCARGSHGLLHRAARPSVLVSQIHATALCACLRTTAAVCAGAGTARVKVTACCAQAAHPSGPGKGIQARAVRILTHDKSLSITHPLFLPACPCPSPRLHYPYVFCLTLSVLVPAPSSRQHTLELISLPSRSLRHPRAPGRRRPHRARLRRARLRRLHRRAGREVGCLPQLRCAR